MTTMREILLEEIEAQARRETARMAGELARAPEGKREEILAALDVERWIAESCGVCAGNR